jgi:hypothetical protein
MNTYFNCLNTQLLDKKFESEKFPFTKYLFWDCAIEVIDPIKHKNYIIERVLSKGFLKDVYLLLKMYTNNEIKEAVKRSKVLDKKTINFCSIFFNISIKELNASPYYS